MLIEDYECEPEKRGEESYEKREKERKPDEERKSSDMLFFIWFRAYMIRVYICYE